MKEKVRIDLHNLDRLVTLKTANFDVWSQWHQNPLSTCYDSGTTGPPSTGEGHRAIVLQGQNLKFQNHVMFMAILSSPGYTEKELTYTIV